MTSDRKYKIWYVTAHKIPTLWAHGVQIMKMCEAFASAGLDITLFAQSPKEIMRDPFLFFGITNRFSIEQIGAPAALTERWNALRLHWFLNFLLFGFRLKKTLVKRKDRPDFLYVREYALLPFLFGLHVPVFFEAHSPPGKIGRFFLRRSMRAIVGVGALTEYVRRDLAQYGVSEEKIILLPDGFSPNDFLAIQKSQSELRDELQLPHDKKIILYVGQLFPWKGVFALIEASRFLGEKIPFEMVIVGGYEPYCSQLRDFARKKNLNHITVIPQQEHRQAIAFMKTADVLVLPSSAKHPHSALYSSPMKLFEYMASGRPIVASDVPSSREILDESDAIFFRPDDPQSLASAITSLFADSGGADVISKNAMQKVKEYTWEKRAEKVLAYLEQVRV